MEIAGYVYAADRMVKRGSPDAVEYHSWSREMRFFIKVRDYDFWKKKNVNQKLSDALTFVSGDLSYSFTFIKGGKDTGQANLYDVEGISLHKRENSVVALFSGGLDSLAGALEVLETTDKNLILISHRSNNSAITQIQGGVFGMLNKDYPGRIQYFPFYCNLHGERAVEETQRSRIFLYTAIAHSLSSLASEEEILVFENGITSINFYKRQDQINARSSRTTHPKALHLLEDFYTMVGGKRHYIRHPFLYNTKTDIFNKIKRFGKAHYINSTISCTKTFLTFENNSQATHCGGCSQCIDRRFAAFASGLEDEDAIYDVDISKDSIKSDEARIHLIDYMRLVAKLNGLTEFSFTTEMMDVLTDLIPYLAGNRNADKVGAVYKLTRSHTAQIISAIKRIQSLQDPLKPKKKNTIHSYIDDREYLKPAVEPLIEQVVSKMMVAIPEAYNRHKPKNENELNDLINALLIADRDDYEREYPSIRFSITRVIPDHSFPGIDLLIEAKYLREGTAKSSITDGIAADITKYPKDKYKLFIVYDPERKISNDAVFKKDFEANDRCTVCVIR
ncbi:MAG: hypothetical protein J0L54_04460 [Chitinophagales bacterium]|nr:hypothetical protein [Chitinophagales bacterium]